MSTKRKDEVRLRHKMPLYYGGLKASPRIAFHLASGLWNVKDGRGRVQWMSMPASYLRTLINDWTYTVAPRDSDDNSKGE